MEGEQYENNQIDSFSLACRGKHGWRFLRLGRLAPGWGAIHSNGYDARKVVGRKAHLDVRIIRLSTIFVPWKAVLA